MIRYSFVMPAYNSETTISKSLDSLIAQKYVNWECIVVNDGSIDATEEIVSEYINLDSRISLYSQENFGTAIANNFGVSLAKGEYITVFPSDDLLAPNYLSVMNKIILKNPGFDAYFVNGYLQYEDDSIELMLPASHFDRKPTFTELVKGCPCSLGAMVRGGLHGEVGGYRSVRYTEDYDFWLRASLAGAVFYSENVPLVYARVSDNQKSADKAALFASDILIMEDLLANANIPLSSKKMIALRKFELERALKVECEDPGGAADRRLVEMALQRSSVRFQNLLESIFGKRGAKFLRPVVFTLTNAIRPIRQYLIRSRLK